MSWKSVHCDQQRWSHSGSSLHSGYLSSRHVLGSAFGNGYLPIRWKKRIAEEEKSFPSQIFVDVINWGTTITRAWGNISLGKSDDKASLRSGELKGLMKICIISFWDWAAAVCCIFVQFPASKQHVPNFCSFYSPFPLFPDCVLFTMTAPDILSSPKYGPGG